MNLKKLIALVLCVAMLAICPGIGRAAENADVSDFQGMDDPQLLRYLEESVYDSLDETLDGSRYIIEDVKAVYISQEYIDEVAFNTRANIYFGYTLSELDDFFDGNRYVFTCGEDGRTAVQEFERYPDNTDAMILKNLAIGTGVILFCVTVSVVSGGVASGAATATAAHTISLVFAASAKTATEMAAGGALFAAATTAVTRGIETGDLYETVHSVELKASESFKWGAIAGSISGGVQETLALKRAQLNGLKMNEVAAIQMDSKWPLDAIKDIHSTAEYEIYKKANLVPTRLSDGSWAYLREIDWSLVDEYGRTNRQRVLAKLAPIDETGRPYELHHIGQRADSPLAILTYAEHHSPENFSALHYAKEGKHVADAVRAKQKHEFWMAVMKGA